MGDPLSCTTASHVLAERWNSLLAVFVQFPLAGLRANLGGTPRSCHLLINPPASGGIRVRGLWAHNLLHYPNCVEFPIGVDPVGEKNSQTFVLKVGFSAHTLGRPKICVVNSI